MKYSKNTGLNRLGQQKIWFFVCFTVVPTSIFDMTKAKALYFVQHCTVLGK